MNKKNELWCQVFILGKFLLGKGFLRNLKPRTKTRIDFASVCTTYVFLLKFLCQGSELFIISIFIVPWSFLWSFAGLECERKNWVHSSGIKITAILTAVKKIHTGVLRRQNCLRFREKDCTEKWLKDSPTLRVADFTRSRNEYSGQVLSSLAGSESVKRKVGTFSEPFRNASPISEGNGLAFSISHEEEAKT